MAPSMADDPEPAPTMSDFPPPPSEEHPYDALPYESSPIEWLAPERLAFASLFHGGPEPPLSGYRYLELGCGNGANLLPLAFYRRNAQFVGLDAAPSACRMAREWARQLKLDNFEIIEADFARGNEQLDGEFDFIVAHGVFSWGPDETRDELLTFGRQRLPAGGLLYLSYNTRPGWDVRGMVRAYLMEQTSDLEERPLERAQLARTLAAKLVPPLRQAEHPFSQLLANELSLV